MDGNAGRPDEPDPLFRWLAGHEHGSVRGFGGRECRGGSSGPFRLRPRGVDGFPRGRTTLHPCAALDSWRGPGFTSRRDLIGEMIAAFKARNIEVYLFTHPLDGHDYSAEQQALLGFNDPTNGHQKWNDFINDVHAEIVERYGRDIVGIGMDSEFGLSTDPRLAGKLDLPRLRATILAGVPISPWPPSPARTTRGVRHQGSLAPVLARSGGIPAPRPTTTWRPGLPTVGWPPSSKGITGPRSFHRPRESPV